MLRSVCFCHPCSDRCFDGEFTVRKTYPEGAPPSWRPTTSLMSIRSLLSLLLDARHTTLPKTVISAIHSPVLSCGPRVKSRLTVKQVAAMHWPALPTFSTMGVRLVSSLRARGQNGQKRRFCFREKPVWPDWRRLIPRRSSSRWPWWGRARSCSHSTINSLDSGGVSTSMRRGVSRGLSGWPRKEEGTGRHRRCENSQRRMSTQYGLSCQVCTGALPTS